MILNSISISDKARYIAREGILDSAKAPFTANSDGNFAVALIKPTTRAFVSVRHQPHLVRCDFEGMLGIFEN